MKARASQPSPSSTPFPRKVVGFIRVSTEMQGEEDRFGLPRQREAIKLIAKRSNLEIIEVVELVGVSGVDTPKHPEMQRILTMAQAKTIAGIVVADFDRLMRAAPFDLSAAAIMTSFREARITIYTGGQELDFSRKESRFMLSIMAGAASFERECTQDRVKGAFEAARKSGKHVGGAQRLPLGVAYTAEKGFHYIRDEVAVMQEAFLLMDQKGVHNVAEIARQLGLQHRTLHGLLRNPIYVGVREYRQMRSDTKITSSTGRHYTKKIDRPEEDIIRMRVIEEGAVAQDRFDRVQAIFGQFKRTWTHRRAVLTNPNILAGILRCGHCGERFYLKAENRKQKGHRGYYRCSTICSNRKHKAQDHCSQAPVARGEAEVAVLSLAREKLIEAETLGHIVHMTRAQFASTKKSLKLDPTDQSARRGRIHDMYEQGAIDRGEYQRRLAALDKMEETTHKVDAGATARLLDKAEAEVVRKFVLACRSFRRITSPESQKLVLQGLFERVEWKDHQITGFKLSAQLVGEIHAAVGQGSYVARRRIERAVSGAADGQSRTPEVSGSSRSRASCGTGR